MRLIQHLQDTTASVYFVPDILLGLLQDGLGKHAGAGAEVVDAIGH